MVFSFARVHCTLVIHMKEIRNKNSEIRKRERNVARSGAEGAEEGRSVCKVKEVRCGTVVAGQVLGFRCALGTDLP